MEARAIQIVKSNDHIFEVDLENLKQILGADDIKDRYVVVISIAGALRTGKSFLLNFMLKYLRAKVSVEKKTNSFNETSIFEYSSNQNLSSPRNWQKICEKIVEFNRTNYFSHYSIKIMMSRIG